MAAMGGGGVRPVEILVRVRGLEPEHAVPEPLGAGHQVIREAVELTLAPRLNAALRGIRRSVVRVRIETLLAACRVDLREEHANIDGQVGVRPTIPHLFFERGVPLAAIHELWAAANERAVFENEVCHGDIVYARRSPRICVL